MIESNSLFESCVTVKKSNGGTVRKHTIKKLNGDSRTADKLANGDINQNNAPQNATSANDTLNVSDSTIQAFQDALHFKPLTQVTSHPLSDNTPQVKRPEQINTPSGQWIENTAAECQANNNYADNGSNNNIDSRTIFQGISLKDFDKHHKLMKEANLEKRRLLSNAIEQR